MPSIRQLVVIDYTAFSDTTHMLVRSSAPTNAEEGSLRLPLQGQGETLRDQTDEALRQLRSSLATFLAGFRAGQQSSESFLNALQGKLKIVLNIHGYSTPLPNFHRHAFLATKNKLARDRAALATSNQTFGDYVVFIDYSWPSEQAFSLSPLSVLRATPFLLRFLLILALLIALVGGKLAFHFAVAAGWSLLIGSLAGVLLGISVALLLLRMVTYFRDRDRAASAAVYDGVELVRWLHQIFLEEITTAAPQIHKVEELRTLLKDDPGPAAAAGTGKAEGKATVELSLLAHSMGCFVATQLVRTLTDVFDPQAIQRWRSIGTEGPFSAADPCGPALDRSITGGIGDLFTLGQLVLASPDIPVWALTNGRSNPLQACLRRFREVFLFTNDADVVLRLLSTLANFFVFPSSSREGGYRLGNVVPLEGRDRWGTRRLDLNQIGFFGMGSVGRLNTPLSLTQAPFKARKVPASHLNLIDCTDYCDEPVSGRGGWGPRLASRGPGWRPLRYLFTLLAFVRGKLDPHGGYFQGVFCLDLIYQLLLSGSTKLESAYPALEDKLNRHQIRWIDVQNPPNC